MKLTIWLVAIWLILGMVGHGQQRGIQTWTDATQRHLRETVAYAVQGTSPEREQLIRAQIATMQPAVLPYRIIFVPHWQYIYATKMYHLHVPTGMTSKMFTHLPSRSVYIDNDRYGGADWLGHCMAHELGHLEQNNADERQAEKAAAKYRRRLKQNPVSVLMTSRF